MQLPSVAQVARKLQAEQDKHSGMDVEVNADGNKLAQANAEVERHEVRGDTVSAKCETL